MQRRTSIAFLLRSVGAGVAATGVSVCPQYVLRLWTSDIHTARAQMATTNVFNATAAAQLA